MPKYRELGFLAQIWYNLSNCDETKLDTFNQHLQLAAADLKSAFSAFLRDRPDSTRPFIVAGHSQGAVLLTKVLAECVQGTPQEKNLVAAYLAGGCELDTKPLVSSHPRSYKFKPPLSTSSLSPCTTVSTDVPIDLFGKVFTSLEACTSPEHLGCVISWDTRTPSFDPTSLQDFGLWPHHIRRCLSVSVCVSVCVSLCVSVSLCCVPIDK